MVAYADDAGAAMRGWRELHEVNQSSLAEWLDVSPSVVSDYENGRRENPGVDFVAEYVSGVVALADGAVPDADADTTPTADRSLGGESEEWGTLPGGLPDNVKESVYAVWDGFERE